MMRKRHFCDALWFPWSSTQESKSLTFWGHTLMIDITLTSVYKTCTVSVQFAQISSVLNVQSANFSTYSGRSSAPACWTKTNRHVSHISPLPSHRDGIKFPFCGPYQWWNKYIRQVRGCTYWLRLCLHETTTIFEAKCCQATVTIAAVPLIFLLLWQKRQISPPVLSEE